MPYRPVKSTKSSSKKKSPATAGRSRKKQIKITIPKSFKSGDKVLCGKAGKGTQRGNKTAAKVLAVCEAVAKRRKVLLKK